MNFMVPDEWEIVQHSTDIQKGRMGFVDRRYQRVQLIWRTAESKPDIQRMFQDLKYSDKKRFPDAEISKNFRLQSWTGYYRSTEEELITHAGYYDKKWNRWIEAILMWPRGYNKDEEYLLLTSFKVNDYKNSTNMTWQAFGMHFTVPKEWKLREVIAGSIQKVFEFTHQEMISKVIKRSVPDAWRGGDMDRILLAESEEYRGETTECSYGRHTARCYSGREKQLHTRWLFGKRYYKYDIIWECAAHVAFFQVTMFTTHRKDDAAWPVSVECCRAS